MRLYLVRHFESEKNRKATLSTAADSDGLTAEGSKRCVEFARVFREELSANGHHVPTILASSSARGMQTASAISKALGVRDVRSCTFLRSTLAGPYGGFSATKIRQTNRKWSDAFQLYKAGLFNQYLFDEPSLTVGAERKSDF